MDLKLHSPVGAGPLTFSWPEDSKSQHARSQEIIETIRWVCEDLPDLKPALENNILKNINTSNYSSIKTMCQRFNRTIDSIVMLEKGTSLPAKRIKKLPSRKLLRFILQQCYNRAVTEPEKLNLYEAFSPEVYGETSFDIICKMIDELNFGEEDLFIDLGSGVGQVVLQVAASTSCKICYGIEKADIPSRYAEDMTNVFQTWLRWYGKKSGEYQLVKGDFLSDKFQEQISNATIIFANNFAFGPSVDHQLKQKFSELQDGTRIVSSKSFCPTNFRINDRNLSDIGAILDIVHCKIFGSVSWTDKPIQYYLQIIDRSKLEKYFESLKSPTSPKNIAKNDVYNDFDSYFSTSPEDYSSNESESSYGSPSPNYNLKRNRQNYVSPNYYKSFSLNTKTDSKVFDNEVQFNKSPKSYTTENKLSNDFQYINLKSDSKIFKSEVQKRTKIFKSEVQKSSNCRSKNKRHLYTDPTQNLNPQNDLGKSTKKNRSPKYNPSTRSKKRLNNKKKINYSEYYDKYFRNISPKSINENDDEFLNLSPNYDKTNNTNMIETNESYTNYIKSPKIDCESQIKLNDKLIDEKDELFNDKSPHNDLLTIDKQFLYVKSPKYYTNSVLNQNIQSQINSFELNESEKYLINMISPESDTNIQSPLYGEIQLNKSPKYNLRPVNNLNYAIETDFDEFKKSPKYISKKVDNEFNINKYEREINKYESPVEEEVKFKKSPINDNKLYEKKLGEKSSNEDLIESNVSTKKLTTNHQNYKKRYIASLNLSEKKHKVMKNDISPKICSSPSNTNDREHGFYNESSISSPINTFDISEQPKSNMEQIKSITSHKDTKTLNWNTFQQILQENSEIDSLNLFKNDENCEKTISSRVTRGKSKKTLSEKEIINPKTSLKLHYKGVKRSKRKKNQQIIGFDSLHSKTIEGYPEKATENKKIEVMDEDLPISPKSTEIRSNNQNIDYVDQSFEEENIHPGELCTNILEDTYLDQKTITEEMCSETFANDFPKNNVVSDQKLIENKLHDIKKLKIYHKNQSLTSVNKKISSKYVNKILNDEKCISSKDISQNIILPERNPTSEIAIISNEQETAKNMNVPSCGSLKLKILKLDGVLHCKKLHVSRKGRKINSKITKTHRKDLPNITQIDVEKNGEEIEQKINDNLDNSGNISDINEKNITFTPNNSLANLTFETVSEITVGNRKEIDENNRQNIDYLDNSTDFSETSIKNSIVKQNDNLYDLSLETSSEINVENGEKIDKNNDSSNISQMNITNTSPKQYINDNLSNKSVEMISQTVENNRQFENNQQKNINVEDAPNILAINVKNSTPKQNINSKRKPNLPNTNLTKNKPARNSLNKCILNKNTVLKTINSTEVVHNPTLTTKPVIETRNNLKTNHISSILIANHLQKLLDSYRDQFLRTLKEMKDPNYKKHIQTLIQQEKDRKICLMNKISELNIEISELLGEGIFLLKDHFNYLNINATPKDLFAAGKDIVHRNIELKNECSRLEVDVSSLEQERSSLVSERTQEIFDKNVEVLNQDSFYVEAILTEAREMIQRNNDLREKVSKLEDQLSTLEKHQAFMLFQREKETAECYL